MKPIFLTLMFILGACFGSFLCCQARRIYLSTSSKKKKKLGKRSVCLHCGYKLKWYDNIPIFSWFFLKGECRKCHKKIGVAEFLSEILTGLAFLMIGTTLDIEWMSVYGTVNFVFTMIFLIVAIFLAIYDGLYGVLPVLGLTIAIAIGFVKVATLIIITAVMDGIATPVPFLMPLAAVSILGGVYLVLYLVSKGKWVGDGDWLLGVAIGLVLMEPWLALITLFIANVLACIIMAPVVKKTKNSKIYFGPFMVIAFVVTYTFSEFFFYALSGLYM